MALTYAKAPKVWRETFLNDVMHVGMRRVATFATLFTKTSILCMIEEGGGEGAKEKKNAIFMQVAASNFDGHVITISYYNIFGGI